jgi:hypothetical protein
VKAFKVALNGCTRNAGRTCRADRDMLRPDAKRDQGAIGRLVLPLQGNAGAAGEFGGRRPAVRRQAVTNSRFGYSIVRYAPRLVGRGSISGAAAPLTPNPSIAIQFAAPEGT